MENSPTWMREGVVVELRQNSNPIGKARILSIDAKRICHNVPLGLQHVLVSLMEVFNNNIELENGEKLVDMIGSFLVWKKSHLIEVKMGSLEDPQQVFANHAHEAYNTRSQPHFDSSGSQSPSDNFEETISGDYSQMPKVKIPKAMWMGMIVKVMDDGNLVFAKATIQVLNPNAKLGEIVLGDTHIGILFHEIIEGATQDHLKYRDCLRSWPIDRLIASDGNLLVFHQECQDVGFAKVNDGKRRYVRIKRIHKSPPSSLSTKEKALSKDGISMLSTKDCCSQRCCQHFDIGLVKSIREKYWSKSYEMRKEEQINAIVNTVHLATGERIVVLEGTTICLEAWRQIHFLGKSRFYETKNAVMVGVRIPNHGNKGKRRMSERVSQAYMAMKGIIDESADNHPAKLRTMADSSRKVLRELPISFTWESIRNKANAENVELGLAPVSQSSVSLLRQRYFKEVAIHKKGNNFSKCTTCSELLQRKSRLTGVKEEIESLKRDEDAHHEEHAQGRLLYHAWRHESIHRPKEVLCIIHDKMDHFKTAIPRIPFVPKSVDSAQKFPITLTGILTHGHGPRAIAQYSVGVWAPDPNMTIGSLDSILRMLENPTPMINSLVHGPDSTNLFEKSLFGRGPTLEADVRKAFEEDLQTISNIESNSAPSTSAIKKPLPRVLKLQLDNCCGDNKNRYTMAYLSLLTAREVFEEIHMGFLMVGHTHEDVDAKFGHFSEALMRHPAFTLPKLMSLLFRASKPNSVPHFVQEVPDFKNFVEPYILKGPDTLVGHLQPRLFRFYVRHDKMPCFQYKLKSTDDNWLPEEGIEMWSWTSDNCPHLPTGVPKRLPMMEMKMLDDVIEGLQKHIKFIQQIISQSSQEAKVPWEASVVYWKRIINILENDEVQYRQEDGDALAHGFWPASNWQDHVPTLYRNFACELEAKAFYVGPRKGKPRDCFNPLVDIVKGLFVLIRPNTEDLKTYPVYMGQVVGDIVEGGINEKGEQDHICEVEWWRPHMQQIRGKKTVTLADRYLGCWNKQWEQDPGYTKEKIKITSVLWCFKPRKNAKRNVFRIAKSHATKALDNLKRGIEDEASGEIADVDIDTENEDDME